MVEMSSRRLTCHEWTRLLWAHGWRQLSDGAGVGHAVQNYGHMKSGAGVWGGG